jgi:hypothetical protein
MKSADERQIEELQRGLEDKARAARKLAREYPTVGNWIRAAELWRVAGDEHIAEQCEFEADKLEENE